MYEPLSFFQVKVTDEEIRINSPAEITCTKGFYSMPLLIEAESSPFTNLTISLDIDNSTGISPLYSNITLNRNITRGFIQFSCSENMTTDVQINYTLSGANMDNMRLSSDFVKVSVKESVFTDGKPSLI